MWLIFSPSQWNVAAEPIKTQWYREKSLSLTVSAIYPSSADDVLCRSLRVLLYWTKSSESVLQVLRSLHEGDKQAFISCKWNVNSANMTDCHTAQRDDGKGSVSVISQLTGEAASRALKCGWWWAQRSCHQANGGRPAGVNCLSRLPQSNINYPPHTHTLKCQQSGSKP